MLHYGCEVWGNHNANDIEKLHLDFIKYVLEVKINTTIAMCYIETGRLPMKIVRIFRTNFVSSCYKQISVF